jgi:hypothetical protein
VTRLAGKRIATVLALALVLTPACGNRDTKPTPAPAPAPAPASSALSGSELAPAQRAVVAAQARRLAAVARQLEDAKSLDDAATAIAAIHASERWRRAREHERYKVVAPEAVETASTRSRELAAALAASGQALEGARTSSAIATAMQSASAAFDAAMRGGLGGLSSDLVDELVYDRDHVCAKAGEPSCAQLPALDAAFVRLNELVPRTGAELRGAATELDAALGAFDTHLHVVLARSAGTGPSFGAPCGPEHLCRWDHECMTETATCEHGCNSGAMNPCPNGRSCRSISELHGTFCR